MAAKTANLLSPFNIGKKQRQKSAVESLYIDATRRKRLLSSINAKSCVRRLFKPKNYMEEKQKPVFLAGHAMNWSDKEWKQNFRITRETYCYLCDKLQPYLQKQLAVREPLSVAQRVAITLWRLGTNVEYRTISHLFGIGLSTVCVVVHEISQVIVEQLTAKYICVPSGQGLKRIVNGFQSKWGFLQCVGAIDGTHIPIISPKEDPLDYYNRKGVSLCDFTSPF